jgi:hypothetical protein
VREELRPVERRNQKLLASLSALFADYRVEQGERNVAATLVTAAAAGILGFVML